MYLRNIRLGQYFRTLLQGANYSPSDVRSRDSFCDAAGLVCKKTQTESNSKKRIILMQEFMGSRVVAGQLLLDSSDDESVPEPTSVDGKVG